MGERVSQLAEELGELLKGRGVNADRVGSRLGPQLAAVVFADADPGSSRSAIVVHRWMRACAAELAPDLAEIFLGATGVTDPQPFLTGRITRLALERGVSERTIQRRVRQACALVADRLDRLSPVPPDENPFAVRGWFVERLLSIARLDEDRPRFIGVRDIRVTLAGVDAICETLSIVSPHRLLADDELAVTATEGGEVTELSRISPSTWRLKLELGRELSVGDIHRVGVSVTVPSREFIKPYNAFVPVRRTRRFTAEVHVGDRPVIARAWRYDGVPPPAMEDGVALAPALDPTGGVLRASWPSVRRGLAYGIGWAWSTD
jgi:hypothetical protein